MRLQKNAGGHEQMASAMYTHRKFAPLEMQRLFEAALFSVAIGNNDAHMRNFSLLTGKDGSAVLRHPHASTLGGM